jgi:DhnA family fructose-bisphosphate aldolase class Ia
LPRPGKDLRLSQIIDQKSKKSLILEADQGLTLGPIPGIEDLTLLLKKIKDKVDAIVLSKGQVGRLIDFFKGKNAPALLIRADWTNAFREEGFILPAREIKYILSIRVEDALMLGASGIASRLFVGYDEDEDEAANVKSIAELAGECESYGVPLLVEAFPIGERVTKENYIDCARLAARIAVEAGADIVAIPYKENANLIHQIIEAVNGPVLISEGEASINSLIKDLDNLIKAGATGLIIGRNSLQLRELPQLLDEVNKLMRKELGA